MAMDRNARLAAWVAENPWRWALVSGSLLTAWALVLFRAYPLVWISLGAVFGIINGWMWRPGGPAHRWRAAILRRFPPKPSQG
jgi:uncharacterized membrane protein YdjX (TVP38/TMEM64 family)